MSSHSVRADGRPPQPRRPTPARGRRPVGREELLDAADRVVLRDGPAASMAAMAAEAGITKPILYRHFTDKSGLYAALAERHTEQLLERIQAALQTPGNRRQRVARVIERYLQAIDEQPQVYRFLMHRAVTEDAAVAGQVSAFVTRMGDLVGNGIALELGLTGPEADTARTWGLGMVGMVQAAGDRWLERRTPTRRMLAEQLTALLWGAYATHPGAPVDSSRATARH